MVQHADIDHTGLTGVGGSVASLDDVGDVNAAAPSDGDVLTWDSTPGEWVAAAPSAGSSGMSYVQIYVPAADPVSLTGSWTIVEYTDIPSATGTAYRGIAYQSSGTQNDEISFDLWMDGGTYAIHLLGRKSSNTGIFTVKVDGSSVGTIDSYAASPAVLSSRLTGVSISSGKRTIQLILATKNASSSGYYGELLQVILRRTA